MSALIAVLFFQSVFGSVSLGSVRTGEAAFAEIAIDGCSSSVVTSKWEGAGVIFKPFDATAAASDVDGWCSISSQPEQTTYTRP